MGVNRSLNKPSAKGLDRDRILGQIARYDALREEEKSVKAEKDDLSAELKEAAKTYGKEDGRSHVLQLGQYSVANRAAVSDVIDQEAALQFLESKGLVDDCTIRVIDKGAVEQCVQSGEITIAELESFMEEKVSFKIEVKKVKNA